MSSAEEDSNSHMSAKPRRATKKRRVALACDMCRKRKIRCDGKQASGKCSNCITYSWDCSFFDATKKFPKGYVEALEAKLKRHEELLNRLHPNEDFTQDVGRPITRDDWSKDSVFGDQDPGASSAFTLPSQFNDSAATEVFLDAANSPCNPRKASQNLAYAKDLHDFDSSDDEISPKLQDLTDNFEELHVGRFHGKSSGAILVKSMIEVRDQMKDPTKPLRTFEDEKREQFWRINPWERQTYESRRPSYIFPEPDLLYQLIDAYFENSNIILPVLHRATFEEGIHSRRYLVDESLGGVVLIACAIGSRFVSDPRVLYPGTNSKLSSGWFWFSQVRFAGKVLIAAARLYDLQITCLGAIYMDGCSAPHASWNMIGIGIRLAQDIGAHRKKVYSSKPTAEDELFKRSFWTLVCLDRWISSSTGRPCAIQEEDFDLEMPLDCDDEYWTHPDPDQAFKQPPGKPSRITAFICNLRLCQILGYAIRTIYASNKAKATYGFSGEDWEQRTIAAFDSILNAWADSVPSHLRWDPIREDDVFFIQSAHLYAQFYDLQITVHRPFIAFREPSPHSFPAIAICTNAARSCMRVVDQLLKRWPTRLFPFMHRTAFASTIVVLLGIWDARRRNPASNVDKEISDAHKGMRFLEVSQDRWHFAGTTRDVLSVLLSLIDLTEIGSDPPRGQKRPHEYVNSTPSPLSAILTPGSTTREYSAAHSRDSSDVASSYAGRAMAGSSRVRAAHEQRSINDSFDDGTLPLRTSELSRVDDSDPLGWGTSSFSFTAEFPPTAIAPNTGVPLTQMDSMFLQPESYASLGGSSAGQSPAGMDMDIGSLFGFGNGGQLPQAPAMDVGATALPYGPFGDLLHNVGTTSSEASANANVWSDTSFEGIDLDWFIPKVFTSQANSGQAFASQSNSGQG